MIIGKQHKLNFAALASILSFAGCGGGSTSSTSATSSPAPSAILKHNYVGAQNIDERDSFSGVWSILVDHSTSVISYDDISIEGVVYGGFSSIPGLEPIVGSFAAAGGAGFLQVTPSAATLPIIQDGFTVGNGLAVEVPGEAMALRPSTSISPPTLSVANDSCPTSSQSQIFQFVAFVPVNNANYPESVAYGSVQATDSGANWTFSNLKMFTWEGVALSPAPLPAGYCALTQEGYAISLPTVAGWNNLPLTAGIGPTGYFILNIGQDPSGGNFNASIPFGLVGIAQPSAPLDVSKLAATKFMGFESDINSPVGNVAVAFGAIAGSVSSTGASITGGAFPNDDITQTPAANITISLGAQDPQNNGLFPAVTAAGDKRRRLTVWSGGPLNLQSRSVSASREELWRSGRSGR
jgi:hypothetical protein